MDLWKKARSSLDKDPEIEISSSDEEMEKSVPMDEGRLLRLSDDQLGRPKAHNSCTSFYRSTGAVGYSKTEVKVPFSRIVRNESLKNLRVSFVATNY